MKKCSRASRKNRRMSKCLSQARYAVKWACKPKYAIRITHENSFVHPRKKIPPLVGSSCADLVTPNFNTYILTPYRKTAKIFILVTLGRFSVEELLSQKTINNG